MSETPLHTEHFTAKERAMSTPWHNTCTHHHPTTGSCSIPPLQIWALGCEHQDSQPGRRKTGNSTMCWDSRCCKIAGNTGSFAGGNELGTHSQQVFFHCHNRGHDPQVLQD